MDYAKLSREGIEVLLMKEPRAPQKGIFTAEGDGLIPFHKIVLAASLAEWTFEWKQTLWKFKARIGEALPLKPDAEDPAKVRIVLVIDEDPSAQKLQRDC